MEGLNLDQEQQHLGGPHVSPLHSLVSHPHRGLNNAHWGTGAVSVLFSWFSLVLRIQLFDLFGGVDHHVSGHHQESLSGAFDLCPFLWILLLIFTGNLTMIGYSLFVNFGHMLGEIDYEAFMGSDGLGSCSFTGLPSSL